MAKFVKKPVVVDAWQFDGSFDSWLAIRNAMDHSDSGAAYNRFEHTIEIFTLEGKMTASPGDWIIKGVKGEFYPCKAEIFETSYAPTGE